MRRFLIYALLCIVPAIASAHLESKKLTDGWLFSRDSLKWEEVSVPHDWAIYGPFDRNQDLQKVAVEQNGETVATWKTGRTGGLPYVGKGYYTTTFEVADITRSHTLLFDGAMSNALVRVNGRNVGYWAYGYNSFWCNIDEAVHPGENILEVVLENKPESSRWYPGAGLYRNVHLLTSNRIHIPVWGTHVTTPYVSAQSAVVNIRTKIAGAEKGSFIRLTTAIKDASGKVVASDSRSYKIYPGQEYIQNLTVEEPKLWSPETPELYHAETKVYVNDNETDVCVTHFGIRTVEVRAGDGFYLNGIKRKFRGVCNHHDLGPLGAAVNKAAIRHQLTLLKDMGCDAIRTAHNMPAPELVELCDEMGFMMMLEPFDDWGFRPKCKNGYGSVFNAWAERDMINMLHRYRNNASVVMWSIGNEVPSQWGPDGLQELNFLQNLVHREDGTRPVTCGMDQFDAVIHNGFAAALDVAGFNYKPARYKEALPHLPQRLILGSETASTVSSRGVYHFPVKMGASIVREDMQCSSYDVEHCYWSNIPEYDFAADDDFDWCMGQFVWTGFDYLGEPTPYDTDAWPAHSSYFGIIDLASIPKDRFYLYRSQWNKKNPTLHVLPHWTWHGREGQVTPVMVYTDSPKAELFINGKSQGIREKNDSTLLTRYRLMWNETVYEPGEIKVVSYDGKNNVTGTKTVKTAGKPHHIVLSPNKLSFEDKDDLIYVTVQVADKDGNIVPADDRMVKYSVSGAAKFRATANGDATCLLPFHLPEMKLFSGAATVIIQSSGIQGDAVLKVTASGVKSASITFPTK